VPGEVGIGETHVGVGVAVAVGLGEGPLDWPALGEPTMLPTAPPPDGDDGGSELGPVVGVSLTQTG
jgi:hypothetical protein